MEFNFTGKIALVTGAGKGIGRAIAVALAKCGAVTHAVSRTQADLDSLQEEIPEILVHQVDLSDWNQTKTVIEKIGVVDMLVNNAGTCGLEPFNEITEENVDRTFGVNVKAAINVSQVVAKGMKERGKGGSIVHISSQASKRALPNHTAYCASKAALDMICKCMALELGPHQIRVNCVNPTVVWTELAKIIWSDPVKVGKMQSRIPLGKFAEVDDVVRPVLFLLSDQAGMITGSTMPVEGGFWSG